MRHAVFLSTLSLRRATTGNIGSVGTARHFYPRSPCGERHQPRNVVDAAVSISIHALLAESDSPAAGKRASCYHFYPRSPCGERLHEALHGRGLLSFLSTLSLRRATQRQIEFERYSDISIHALLAESDQRACVKIPASAKFLSTLSLRRATWTHWPSRWSHSYFYPRSPCGERLLATRVPHPPR